MEHKTFGSTDGLMLLVILIWSLNFSFIKIALREFSPLGFNGIRLVFASLVLLIILGLSRQGLSFARKEYPWIFLMGLTGNTGYQLLFIQGLDRTTASNTGIIIALSPVFIALTSCLFRHERLNWAAWMGIALSFGGFFLVVTEPRNLSFSGTALCGDLMILGGNLLWAIYTVMAKPLLAKYSPLKITTVTMAIGTVFYLPFALPDMLALPIPQISSRAWGALGYSGLFAQAVSYIIWYASVRRVGNARTAIYGNFMPVMTVVFAFFFLGERISGLQAFGVVIIFAGVYLARSGYRLFDRGTPPISGRATSRNSDSQTC